MITIPDRQTFLRSAQDYFTFGYNYAIHSKHLLTKPITTPDVRGDLLGMWRASWNFSDNHVLKFRDTYRKIDDKKVERLFNFDFRIEHAPDQVFRFDHHGVWITSEETCHLDLADGNRYEDGHSALKGYPLRYLTICDVLSVIDIYLEKGDLPWA